MPLRRSRKNYVGLKLNGTHHLLVYANDVLLFGDRIDIMEKSKTVIEASKEVGLEVNAETIKYI
jgi:hypothetical protein